MVDVLPVTSGGVTVLPPASNFDAAFQAEATTRAAADTGLNLAARRQESVTRRRQTVAGDAGVTVAFAQKSTTDLSGTVSQVANLIGTVATYVRFSNCGAGAPVNPAAASFYGPRARSASGGDTWGGLQTYDWIITSSDFEFIYQFIQGQTGWLDLYVDDILVGSWTSAYVADQYWKCRITPSVGQRTMRVRVNTNMGFRLFFVVAASGDRVHPAPTRPIFTRRVYIKGDSYVAGQQDPTGKSWVGHLSDILGWECLRGGYSSTGYTTNGGGASGKLSYPDSVTPDIVPHAPELVVVAGSINDASDTSGVRAAATEMYAALRTALPTVPVIVVGPQYGLGSGPSDSVCDTMQAALVAAAADSPNVLGVISTKGLFTGSGDPLIAVDGVHPTAAGHLAYAEWVADRIETLLEDVAL